MCVSDDFCYDLDTDSFLRCMKEQIGGPKKVKQHVNPEAHIRTGFDPQSLDATTPTQADTAMATKGDVSL